MAVGLLEDESGVSVEGPKLSLAHPRVLLELFHRIALVVHTVHQLEDSSRNPQGLLEESTSTTSEIARSEPVCENSCGYCAIGPVITCA